MVALVALVSKDGRREVSALQSSCLTRSRKHVSVVLSAQATKKKQSHPERGQALEDWGTIPFYAGAVSPSSGKLPFNRHSDMSPELNLALKSLPLLTHEEEMSLGRSIQELRRMEESEMTRADALKKTIIGRAAREKMMLSNSRLVVSYAWRAHKSNFAKTRSRSSAVSVDRDGDAATFGDLVAEGFYGLAIAVDRYEPDRGFRFSTYATWWIRQAIQKAVRCKTFVLLPASVQALARHAQNVSSILEEELGRTPTSAEFAARSALTSGQLELVRRAAQTVVSLDVPVSGSSFASRSGTNYQSSTSASGFYDSGSPSTLTDGAATLQLFGASAVNTGGLSAGTKSSGADDDCANLSDLIEADEAVPEHAAAFSHLREAIDQAMAKRLLPTERDVIRLRLGLDDGYFRTRAQVSKITHHSVPKIRAIENTAIRKLRKDHHSIDKLQNLHALCANLC